MIISKKHSTRKNIQNICKSKGLLRTSTRLILELTPELPPELITGLMHRLEEAVLVMIPTMRGGC
jgi:hypothetical protein